jgi:uncharacterized protein (DUF1697 family)
MTAPKVGPARRYVAFLRAINVGGHVVTMDRLRAEFEALGLDDVATFIASGNVLFTSRAGDAELPALESRIERQLEQSLGYAVETFLRSAEELNVVLADDPFAARNDSCTLHVGFVKSALSSAARDRFVACRTDTDEFAVQGREVFWLCRTRVSESTVSGPRMERALATPVTFRNVNTVRRLSAKLAAE